MQYLGEISKMTETSQFVSKVKHSTSTGIQVNSPTTNVKEAEVEWFYGDLQDLLELAPGKKKKKSLFQE